MNTAYSHQRKWPCRGHLDLTVARFYRVTSCGHRGRKSRLPFATGRHTAGRRIDVANELEHAARRVRRLTASSRGIAELARARLLTHSPFKLSLGLPASATSLSTAGRSRAARKAQAARRPLLAQWITHLDSELHPAGAMDASPTHRVTSSSNLLFQLVLESDATCLDVEALKIRLMQQAPMGSTAESQLDTPLQIDFEYMGPEDIPNVCLKWF